ncbi:hypothetical protein AHAS_Ahas06G0135800 [Arachis hypogaea]
MGFIRVLRKRERRSSFWGLGWFWEEARMDEDLKVVEEEGGKERENGESDDERWGLRDRCRREAMGARVGETTVGVASGNIGRRLKP